MRDHDDQDLDPSLRARLEALEQEVLAERGRHAAAEADARRYRLLLDSVQDYAFITFNRELRVIGWSRGAELILGYPEAEAMELHSGTFFTPEDIAREEHMKEALKAREDGRAEDERWHIRGDGTRFWGSGVMTSLRGEDGDLQGYSKVIRDHTSRRMAEEAEAQREAQRQRERQVLHHRIQSTGEALDRTKEELRALAGSLIDAQEEERRRIARDLHDDLSQRLAVLRFGLGKLRGSLPGASALGLGRIEEQVESLAQDVRRLSHQLHPAILDDLGLAAALCRLAEECSESRSEPIIFNERDVPTELPPAVSRALYRVAQEALRNVGKHAGASPVALSVMTGGSELQLAIADSGPGFDVVAVRGRGGLGIISMQERLRLIGGVLQIESSPGHGTTVLARVPLTKETP